MMVERYKHPMLVHLVQYHYQQKLEGKKTNKYLEDVRCSCTLIPKEALVTELNINTFIQIVYLIYFSICTNIDLNVLQIIEKYPYEVFVLFYSLDFVYYKLHFV